MKESLHRLWKYYKYLLFCDVPLAEKEKPTKVQVLTVEFYTDSTISFKKCFSDKWKYHPMPSGRGFHSFWPAKWQIVEFIEKHGKGPITVVGDELLLSRINKAKIVDKDFSYKYAPSVPDRYRRVLSEEGKSYEGME